VNHLPRVLPARLLTARPASRLIRPSRRKAVASAGVAALALSLAACGGGSDGDSAAAVPAPTDKVLHLSFLQDPGQPPDPDIYYAGQGLLLTTNLYEGLLAYKPGTDKPEIVPALATEWKVSDDFTTYELTLRDDVTFVDGTPFTSAAVKPSFDRRLAVAQGPSYMVADVKSVTTDGDDKVKIVLNKGDAAFLDYLAAPYGPKMFSPTALKEHAGKDHAQTYMQTHSIGTGPYTLTDAKVGSHFAMKFYDGYWGDKAYFTDIDLPVLGDTSTQQLEFDKGQIAAVLHDLPASSVASYLKKSSITSYSLPTFMSDFLYINPNKGMLKEKANRVALQKAIDVESIFKQAYAGRGEVADQAYPAHMIGDEFALQKVTHDPAPLTGIAASLPADQKTITVGYDSSSTDNQLVANLISTQLAAAGLTAKVQGFPTSQIFGWVGNGAEGPDLLATLGWPDAAPPVTWGYISYHSGAGLNYFGCSTPEMDAKLDEAGSSEDDQLFSDIGELAIGSGCWLNLVDQNDFMVAHPWLKGVKEAHVIAQPMTLSLELLSVN
jgi:peptide/nickel transport system substrate-binding protein